MVNQVLLVTQNSLHLLYLIFKQLQHCFILMVHAQYLLYIKVPNVSCMQQLYTACACACKLIDMQYVKGP